LIAALTLDHDLKRSVLFWHRILRFVSISLARIVSLSVKRPCSGLFNLLSSFLLLLSFQFASKALFIVEVFLRTDGTALLSCCSRPSATVTAADCCHTVATFMHVSCGDLVRLLAADRLESTVDDGPLP